MADAERVARLRLIRSENVGPVTFRQLIARFGTGVAALAALPDLARRGGGRAPRIASEADALRELTAVEKFGGQHLFWGLQPYPTLLAQIEDAPPVIAVKGDPSLATRKTVGMVGARNASAAAVRFARELATGLAEEGVVVVSGLARGIDSAAHVGSISSGTIAVIAGGLNIVYPHENAALQERIAAEGLLVAEQPLGTEPQARHFPRRNRIISGLSHGVVIVEAAPRSGSLITARFAGEQGREVMAVPGSPLDPRAQGCNGLIRDGATLVQSAADIIETLEPLSRRFASPPASFDPPPSPDADDSDRDIVTNLLGPVAVSIDELIRQSGLSPSMLHTILLELEIGGRLERHAGGRVSLMG